MSTTPLEKLQALVKEAGSQLVVAESLGISPSYLNEILSGKRNITDNLARKLGFLRLTTWTPIKPDTGLAVSVDGKIHGDQIGDALARYDRES